jgi:hypothetical protein
MPPSRTVAPYSPAWTTQAPGRSWVTGGIWALSYGIQTCSNGSLGEVKRRTKVIGWLPGKDSRLTPVWAVLDLSTSSTTLSSPRSGSSEGRDHAGPDHTLEVGPSLDRPGWVIAGRRANPPDRVVRQLSARAIGANKRD